MIGTDNRYTSCDLFVHLKLRLTNAFGTVRKGRMYLPDDAEDMFTEAKKFKPGEYRSRYSERAGLVFEVIQSNNRVRVLSNCHATTDNVEKQRFVKDADIAGQFEEADLGRRKINTSRLLKDYSLTMNNTDCGAGLGGRLTKYHRKSTRLS